MREHNQYIDIIKGLSIISIVIGHSCWNLPYNGFPIGSVVYTYHIMTFIFVAELWKNKHLTSDNIQNDNGFFFSNRDIWTYDK